MDSENLFHFYPERTNDKFLPFNIVYFPNFEISASLKLALLLNKRCTSRFYNLVSAGALIRGNTVY